MKFEITNKDTGRVFSINSNHIKTAINIYVQEFISLTEQEKIELNIKVELVDEKQPLRVR